MCVVVDVKMLCDEIGLLSWGHRHDEPSCPITSDFQHGVSGNLYDFRYATLPGETLSKTLNEQNSVKWSISFCMVSPLYGILTVETSMTWTVGEACVSVVSSDEDVKKSTNMLDASP